MSRAGRGRQRLPACRTNDPDLWFAAGPADLERAERLCFDCPLRVGCLADALVREEPWGVWGGEILDRGVVIAHKRPRGRPVTGKAGAALPGTASHRQAGPEQNRRRPRPEHVARRARPMFG